MCPANAICGGQPGGLQIGTATEFIFLSYCQMLNLVPYVGELKKNQNEKRYRRVKKKRDFSA